MLADNGLREAILDFHQDLSPPATHNRNTQREVIDGLWVLIGIQIAKGGYLAFGEGCPSDHRALFFDITYAVAFGQHPTEMALLQPKRLKAKDPRIVKNMSRHVKLRMLESDFKQRFEEFKLTTKLEWTASLQVDYNKLQKENMAIRKAVEGKLRKLCMGGVPWSVELQSLRDKIELWAMLVRKKKNVQISVKRIRRFLKKFPKVENAFTCSLVDALEQRHSAYKEYKVVQKTEAIKMRQDFQGTLAEAISLKKGTDSEQEAQNLIRIERQRRQARNVKRMRGKMGNYRVTKLWYTEDGGSRIECSTQSTMERACFSENETRFSQTELTPPMTEPTLSDLGFLGDTEQADQILAGNYVPPPGTNKYMAELLEELRMPPSVRKSIAKDGPISVVISLEENKSGWKKSKIASAEALGLTMDHYVVGSADPELNSVDTLL
jgi:hypothetical protein